MSKPAIHKTAFVADDVVIGDGTVVGPNAVILAPSEIGRECWIGPNVVIGTTAQDIDGMTVRRIPTYYDSENLEDNGFLDEFLWNTDQGTGVVIGDRTIIREHSAIQQGTIRDTVVGTNCFLMHGVHIAHDMQVGSNVRMAPGVVFGGHCVVGDGANLGMGAIVHQRREIGIGTMIGMNSTLTKDTGAYEMWYGSPATKRGINRVMLEKDGYTEDEIVAMERTIL